MRVPESVFMGMGQEEAPVPATTPAPEVEVEPMPAEGMISKVKSFILSPVGLIIGGIGAFLLYKKFK